MRFHGRVFRRQQQARRRRRAWSIPKQLAYDSDILRTFQRCFSRRMAKSRPRTPVSIYTIPFPHDSIFVTDFFCHSNDVQIATACQRQLWETLGPDQYFGMQRFVGFISTDTLNLLIILSEVVSAIWGRDHTTRSTFTNTWISSTGTAASI